MITFGSSKSEVKLTASSEPQGASLGFFARVLGGEHPRLAPTAHFEFGTTEILFRVDPLAQTSTDRTQWN